MPDQPPAPAIVSVPAKGGWGRRRAWVERVEPVWSVPSSEQPPVPDAGSGVAGKNQSRSLAQTLTRFFTAPINPDRPVLALWWGIGEHPSFEREDALPMAVTDEHVLGWMTRTLGGKSFPLQAAPSFEFDSIDWKNQVLIPRHDAQSPFRHRIGVWVARTATQLLWGMGATRWCLDFAQNTLMRTGWRSTHGWMATESLAQGLDEWYDLLGLQPFDRFAMRRGWSDPALNRAWGSQGLPDRREWDDPTPRAWALACTTGATEKDRDVRWMPEPLALSAGPHPDRSWLTIIEEHAQEWAAAHHLLVKRCRQLARTVRRADPELARWGRWLWSNPTAGYALSHALSHGWAHRRAFDALYQESPAMGEWLKLRFHASSTTAVWHSGHAGSDANLGTSHMSHVWATPASRRWARRQAPAAVRAWLRLEHACETREEAAEVLAWVELLARWNVQRFPNWAIRALHDQNDLRLSVVPVLLQELNDLAQPSYEQYVLRQNLQARRAHRPHPQGLRWMLRAWVQDVIARPWSERSGREDPLDLNAWSIAFQRAGSVVPAGHERWSWARWRAWARQDQDWERWLARNGVGPGGLLIDEDGWCLTGWAPIDAGATPATAWPERYPVSSAEDASPDGDAGALGLSWLDRSHETTWEAWTMAHATHGREVVVLRRQWNGWSMDPARTPPAARVAAQAWAGWRSVLDQLLEASAREGRRETLEALPPAGLNPRWLLPAMDAMETTHVPLALGRMDLGDWSMVPVGRTDDLVELGRLMANCVGEHGYGTWMATGLCRLFVLYGLGRPVLIDLRYDAHARKWAVHQVETHDNGRATLGMTRAAQALAALYSRLCPHGHAALPGVESPNNNGFDADRRARPLLLQLATELGEDAMGLRRTSATAPVPSSDGETVTMSGIDDGDSDGATPSTSTGPERPRSSAPEASRPNPMTNTVDPSGLIDLIVDLMDPSNRVTTSTMTRAYEPGEVPRVDEALIACREALPANASWATVVEHLYRNGDEAAARTAQRHAGRDAWLRSEGTTVPSSPAGDERSSPRNRQEPDERATLG